MPWQGAYYYYAAFLARTARGDAMLRALEETNCESDWSDRGAKPILAEELALQLSMALSHKLTEGSRSCSYLLLR